MKRFIKNYTVTTLIIIAISLIALLLIFIAETFPQIKILLSKATGVAINNEINTYYNWASGLSVFIIGNLIITAIYTVLGGGQEMPELNKELKESKIKAKNILKEIEQTNKQFDKYLLKENKKKGKKNEK